mgnify:CR=1 FL=1
MTLNTQIADAIGNKELLKLKKTAFILVAKVHHRNAVWGSFSFNCGTGGRCLQGQLYFVTQPINHLVPPALLRNL